MARDPYQLPSEADRRAPEWVKAVSALMALAAWALLLFMLMLASGRSYGAPAIAELGILSFFGAGAFAFVGSAISLFAVSKKEKREDAWLRAFAVANYCALAVLIALPLVQSCTSRYR
jgi:hypothetical protein